MKALGWLLSLVWVSLLGSTITACECEESLASGAGYQRTLTFPAGETFVFVDACWNDDCGSAVVDLGDRDCDACRVGYTYVENTQYSPALDVRADADGWKVSVSWVWAPPRLLHDGDVYTIHIGTDSEPDIVDFKKKVTYEELDSCSYALWAKL